MGGRAYHEGLVEVARAEDVVLPLGRGDIQLLVRELVGLLRDNKVYALVRVFEDIDPHSLRNRESLGSQNRRGIGHQLRLELRVNPRLGDQLSRRLAHFFSVHFVPPQRD